MNTPPTIHELPTQDHHTEPLKHTKWPNQHAQFTLKIEDGVIEDRVGSASSDNNLNNGNSSSSINADKDLKQRKENFEELCDEDNILVFSKKLLNKWKWELN